jgi:hypothetical protein
MRRERLGATPAGGLKPTPQRGADLSQPPPAPNRRAKRGQRLTYSSRAGDASATATASRSSLRLALQANPPRLDQLRLKQSDRAGPTRT